ncbi:hypothetical protein Pst134EA_005406 [Puccinia striiformis f. sp. tritici]|nr:hypothetical protein Pst134EA_005406 [Puccinia striiformis f. sp. tritici]KAI9618975.1 hypothetical protein H4Q26_012234 [Puccinia striiformis f. sp. tritici PST-130]KNE93464.1 hypothetical protein PSTG_13187 [Puccinia striiformis f. sp. tritici PST-78]POW20860.1 hypothetical protein PSHT_03131 [Puccinia striiformis]KAH9462604.1 hypothetical protein Pst134EB_006492 [Puccinia striiformis f. sp. tritici]KAH9471510.1 hypothetical protein Pst134EA_005406 [Puccinia striiformis f. sp. tritici]
MEGDIAPRRRATQQRIEFSAPPVILAQSAYDDMAAVGTSLYLKKGELVGSWRFENLDYPEPRFSLERPPSNPLSTVAFNLNTCKSN